MKAEQRKDCAWCHDEVAAARLSERPPPHFHPECLAQAKSWHRAHPGSVMPGTKVPAPPSRDATRGKINRMFKYFRGKKVAIRYEYNDSMGGHQVREACTKFDSFEIIGAGGQPNSGFLETEWVVVLSYKGREVFRQAFGSYWEFTGLGRLHYCNSGPYCYFSIKPVGWFTLTHREIVTESGDTHD